MAEKRDLKAIAEKELARTTFYVAGLRDGIDLAATGLAAARRRLRKHRRLLKKLAAQAVGSPR